MGRVRGKALFCNAVDYVGWLKGEPLPARNEGGQVHAERYG